MTTTAFFTGSAPASGPMGNRAAPVSSLVNKAMTGAQAAFKAPRTAAPDAAPYPWMTQAMLSKLGVRTLRLLRADC